MRRAAWIGATFGCVALSLLPGLSFAAEKKEVIAVENPGLPGAIVCPEPQALEFAIQRQRQRSGFGFSLPPSCMLVGAGTVMESEGLDWHGFPIVAITVASGRRITGTTASFMVEQFVEKARRRRQYIHPYRMKPKQARATTLAASVAKPAQADAKRAESANGPAQVAANAPPPRIAVDSELSNSRSELRSSSEYRRI